MQKAVTAIIGIIIMVAIVILLAVIVFVYITDLQQKNPEETYVTGRVIYSIETNKTLNINNESIPIWNISLNNSGKQNSYQICFIENISPPPLDAHLKMYYHTLDDILLVYKIKSL